MLESFSSRLCTCMRATMSVRNYVVGIQETVCIARARHADKISTVVISTANQFTIYHEIGFPLEVCSLDGFQVLSNLPRHCIN